jgi:hypothetical protein
LRGAAAVGVSISASLQLAFAKDAAPPPGGHDPRA